MDELLKTPSDDHAEVSQHSHRRIVILGGGFGGAYCAQALAGHLQKLDAELWLLDRHNYFVFFPLLIEAGTGSLEPRHVIVPIRDFLPVGEFRMAEVIAVDLAAQIVTYRMVGSTATCTVDYDQLVLALGSVTRMPDVPGIREHCYVVKSLTDAVALRDRAIQMLELANATDDPDERRALLHFVVVGGNFTGVEVAGEFDEFLRHATRRYSRLTPGDCRMTLVELSDRILQPLGGELSDFALNHLRRRGIDVRLNTSILEVMAKRVKLMSGELLDVSTVIWCAGIEPNPLLRNLPLPHDDLGYILCERDLCVKGFDNVWAIGDCAVNTDEAGQAYPATAQHAIRQGRILAGNLRAVLTGRPTRPCNLKSQGVLAALGCRTGVAKVFGIKLSGFGAWWLWRTVYLLKMPRLARKVRVALDWTIGLLFSRDYVQLGVHRYTETQLHSHNVQKHTPTCEMQKHDDSQLHDDH